MDRWDEPIIVGGPELSQRRDFLASVSSIVMAGGLVGGYGTFAWMAGRYLYPTGPSDTGWMFVTTVASMRPGDSKTYRAPAGHPIVVTRLGQKGTVADFVALSSVCPHLGCQVHWETQNQRFFCPCHNGAFDVSGKPLEGPPKDAQQSLPHYPLKVESGMLFIEVPLTVP